MKWTYQVKTEQTLKNWYSNKKSSNKEAMGFASPSEFVEWYRKQEKVCHYCGLEEEESQEIVHKGLLTSNRFPLAGRLKQGVNRAYWLEIDRKEPKGKYDENNAVLSCYFCNNDKSDVFSAEQYFQFFQNRRAFLLKLLKK